MAIAELKLCRSEWNDSRETLRPSFPSFLRATPSSMILEFKERWLSGGRSPRTVNQTIKILKRPFKIALEQGLIDRNPVAAVRPIRTSSAKKGVFSPEQIRQLLEAAEGEWKGLILSAYFTGGRLTDLARLTWGDIDLSGKTITFVQRKTGSYVQIPIHQDLYEYLVELPGSDRPKRPVFSKLFDKPGAGKSGLSMSFKRLMERASHVQSGPRVWIAAAECISSRAPVASNVKVYFTFSMSGSAQLLSKYASNGPYSRK